MILGRLIKELCRDSRPCLPGITLFLTRASGARRVLQLTAHCCCGLVLSLAVTCGELTIRLNKRRVRVWNSGYVASAFRI